jgi:NAD(P)H-hydrate epimerase
MSGAAALAMRAAYRSGAGLVYGLVPDAILDSLAARLDEAVLIPAGSTVPGALSCRDFSVVAERLEAIQPTAMVIGPGIGRVAVTHNFILELLGLSLCPVVLDADGLWMCRSVLADLQQFRLVLTPHPGEMAYLLDTTTDVIQGDREGAVKDLVARTGAIVVLKGHNTIISDGQRTVINPTGGPALATGGTGDVLAGVIGALIAQGMNEFDAAVAGTWLHGQAGDSAAATKGDLSVIASDVIAHLPDAIRAYAS